MEHTPIPDGKTGPFMRKPHNKITPEGAGYAYDERCPACRVGKVLEQARPAIRARAWRAAEQVRREGMR